MSVSVYFSTGRQPEDTLGYDHAIGLEPTSLDLKIHHNLGLLGSGTTPVAGPGLDLPPDLPGGMGHR